MVDAIPSTYRRITPCLVVSDGDAALRFYAEVFGAEVRMRSATPDGRLAHAEIVIGDSVVIVSDAATEMGTSAPPTGGFPGTPTFLFLYAEDVDKVVSMAAAHGAEVRRPARDQFYGDRDAFVVDPFGHGWTIATHIEDVTPEELDRRMRSFL